MVNTLIICITVLIALKIAPTQITFNLNKTIRVIQPDQPAAPVQHPEQEQAISKHDELLSEINTIMSNLNGGTLE